MRVLPIWGELVRGGAYSGRVVVTIEGREGSVARRAVWLEMKFGNEKPFEMDFAGLETRRRRRSATLNDVLEAILRHVPELEFTEQNSTH